jgi:DNA-binding PadR family transcriptional regulator
LAAVSPVDVFAWVDWQGARRHGGTETLYPNLAKLERHGWLSLGKEDIDPRVEGRPARRFYRITGAGEAAARLQLAELVERYRPPAVVRPRLSTEGSTL